MHLTESRMTVKRFSPPVTASGRGEYNTGPRPSAFARRESTAARADLLISPATRLATLSDKRLGAFDEKNSFPSPPRRGACGRVLRAGQRRRRLRAVRQRQGACGSERARQARDDAGRTAAERNLHVR